MDTLPLEIINYIIIRVNPLDYTNFILSYDRVMELWYDEDLRRKYKEQFLICIETINEMYYIRTDNSKKHGKYEHYHDNGKLSFSMDYVDGVEHGKYLEYYDDNQLKFNIDYINDQEHGKYLSYYSNGQLWYDIDYKNGMRHGKCLGYQVNGKLSCNIDFIADLRHGKCLEYNEEGQLYCDAEYADGAIII